MPYGQTQYPHCKRAQSRLFDQIIEAGRQGKSRVQISEMIGISRETLHQWVEQYPELKPIMQLADDYALAWWEALGQRHAETREGNAPMIIFVMKNRFGQDYDRDAMSDDAPENTKRLATLSAEARHALRGLLQQFENHPEPDRD